MNNTDVNETYTKEDLENLLDSIPYEVWMKDEKGRHIYINKICAERMGYSKEDIIGKTDAEFRPKEMTEVCMKSDQETLKRNAKVLSREKVNMLGKERWYETYKFVLDKYNSNSKIISGIAKEITFDKKIESGILKTSLAYLNSNSEENDGSSKTMCGILAELKYLLEASGIALYSYNPSERTLNKELCIGERAQAENIKDRYLLNEEQEKKMIYSKTELHDARPIREFPLLNNCIGDVYVCIFPVVYKSQLLGEISIYYNKPRNTKHIQEEYMDSVCFTIGMMIVNKRLNKKLNQELREKEETQKKLEMFLDTATDIYALSIGIGDEPIWIEISEKCKELLGWDKEELKNKRLIDFVHEDDREKFKSALKKSQEKGKARNVVLKNLCKNGEYKDVEWNWSYINKNYMCVITGRDVTEKLSLRAEKKHLEDAIEMESLKTEFFANISHEFKTPLNIIITTVQLIEECLKNKGLKIDYEFVNKYMKGIKQNSYRLLRLSNNLIDITKIDGGYYKLHLCNCNIVSVVENIVLSVVDYIHGNDKNITFDTTEEEIITACDQEKIERIILNLLSNSIKYTRKNGHIFVLMKKEDSKVIISVKNDGYPIDPSEQDKIFDRFTRSEEFLTRKCEGSGIGLSLVKGLVELHGGRIYLNVENKKETEFVIELPIRKVEGEAKDNENKELECTLENFNIEFSDLD